MCESRRRVPDPALYAPFNYGRRSSARDVRLSLKAKETSRLAYGSEAEDDASLPVKKRRIKEELVSEVNSENSTSTNMLSVHIN